MPFNCIVSLINNNNNNTRYPYTSSIHFQLLTPNRGKSLFLRISTEALSSTMELNIQIKLPFTTWSTQNNLLLLLPKVHRSTIDHWTIPDWTTEVFPRRNRVTVFIERLRIDMQNNFASSALQLHYYQWPTGIVPKDGEKLLAEEQITKVQCPAVHNDDQTTKLPTAMNGVFLLLLLHLTH